MIAYHGSEQLKIDTMAEVAAHAAADAFVQGTYWDELHRVGCSVGCMTQDPAGGHEQYETRWGIPRILARLEEHIFEGLTVASAMAWPGRFMGSIPVGADLSGVWDLFAVCILTDPVHGVSRLCKTGSPQRLAVDAVAALYMRRIAGDAIAREEWQDAAKIAFDAADAADAAAAAAAAYAAAYAAADADPYRIALAASAADAAAASAASADTAAARRRLRRLRLRASVASRSISYAWQAATLTRLLREARIVEGPAV